MDRTPAYDVRRWFDPQYGLRDRLIPRWIVLRCLGLIYFSAFYSLLFQIRGLIGPDGILPASEYLEQLKPLGVPRFWYAPTLLGCPAVITCSRRSAGRGSRIGAASC